MSWISFDRSLVITENAAEEGDAEADDDLLDLGDVASELTDMLSSIGGAELTPGFTQFRLGQHSPPVTEKSIVIGAYFVCVRVSFLAACVR